MKLRSILGGLLAMAAIAACKPDEILVEPELDLNKTSASVTAEGGEVEFEVTSNVDWTADADQDWVSVDPQTGKGNAKVKATVAPNETEEARTATVTVKADKLTKTLKITQTGKEKEEEPTPPEPEKQEYLLVGDAVDCGWDPANGIVLTLTDGYYVAKEVGIQANKGMHFTKNAAWEGNVKGLHGLIAPNEIGEVGNNDIALTTGGAYDVYLAEALDKFYFMTPGKTPAEAVEHVDIAVSWGMMGMFVGNEWGSDIPMEYEGDWIVAKGAEFSALTFKIRGNGSWSDPTNIGMAPGSEKGVINGKISVVTAEYSKANLGGDAADIKLNGEAGVYDVYFNFENLEVYVMEPGYKPGEKEPQNPDPVDPSQISYTVVGTLNNINWDNAAAEGQMTYDGTYHVAQNVPFVWASTLYGGPEQIEFKIVETGTWDGFGVAAGTEVQAANAEIAVVAGGDNICVAAAEGAYDVYLDAANGKVWVMTPGYKPGETPEIPEVPEPDYEKISANEVTEWGLDAMTTLLGQYGSGTEVTEDFVYESLYFYAGGGKFKFGENNNAAGEKVARVQFGGKGDYEKNKQLVKFYVSTPGTLKVEAISSGSDARPLMVAIDGALTSEAGYELPDKTGTPVVVEVDCSAAADGSEIALWSGNSGINVFSIKWIPAGVTEQPEQPEQPEPLYVQWLFTADAMSAYADTFGTVEGVADKTAGDGGMYVQANVAGEGKISYVQVDKSEIDVDGKATRITGGTGHPYVTGIWPGDYWLFEATDGTEYAAGTSVNISYITRTSKTGHKYWRLEYLDGEEWKPAMETASYTLNEQEFTYNIAMNNDGKTNVEVNATVDLSVATKVVKFRMLCVANGQSSNEAYVAAPNGGTCRIAGDEATSPVIKVVK